MSDTTPVALYADGGVIDRNPSSFGGTWAWCHVNAAGERILCKSGVVLPHECGNAEGITNNFTEMIALIYGLECLPRGWQGTVYSDSRVTLGRLFEGWKLNGIPPWLLDRIGALMRYHDLTRIGHVLLDGHPTQAHIEAGKGKRGNPVSVHNVWCDRACGKAGRQFRRESL